MSFFNRIRPDPGFVSPVQSDPIQLLLVRSDPIRSDAIRSGPVRSGFCQRPLINLNLIKYNNDEMLKNYTKDMQTNKAI